MKFTPGLLRRPSRALRTPIFTPGNYYPPKHIDRRPELLAASDQGQTSMCVAYAVAGWIEHYRWKYNGDPSQVDPVPIYEQAKKIDGFPTEQGTSLEAGLESAVLLGLLPKTAGVREVNSEFGVKQALHRYGVVLGAFTATELWSSPGADGWMQPNGSPVGGHAVLLAGFSDVEEPPYFSLQNSWGDIGWRGFVRMSPEQFRAEFDYGLVWDFQS